MYGVFFDAPGSHTVRVADPGGSDASSFTICARGDYPAYAVLPQQGNVRTATVPPGSCLTRNFSAYHGDQQAQIFGVDSADKASFLVGEDTYGGDDDERVRTTGTTLNPDWSTY